MDEKIKDKVREIQSKYCGEAIEIKLYHAIEEGIKIGKENQCEMLRSKIKGDGLK